MFRLAHFADLHFSVKPEKLEETTRVTDAALALLAAEPVELIVLSGDTVDEHDGAIRVDSPAARAAISFVQRAAELAPVAIVTGTPSHDRETPYLFRHLASFHPIYVADKIEMMALRLNAFTRHQFTPYEQAEGEIAAVLTFIPSPDKSKVIAAFGGESKQLTNLCAKEVLHDALAYIGEINATVPAGIPRILIGHGMITGAQYSTGAVSTGEDFEFGVSDLHATNTDYKAFGHVHKFQTFPGNIVYAGSPGRLNFGEVENKGFVLVQITPNGTNWNFVQLPARTFLIREHEWKDETGADGLMIAVEQFSAECNGCDVRFRYTVPEEDRHKVVRPLIEEMFLSGGARIVKIECTIVPRIRARAAGISRLETLPEKIDKWASTVGVDVPPRVMEIAATIEGKTVAELLPDKSPTNAAPTLLSTLAIDETGLLSFDDAVGA